MIFKDVPCGDQKRSLRVHQVNGDSGGLGKFDLNLSSVKISTEDEMKVLQRGTIPLKLVDIAGIDQALEKLNDFLGDLNEPFEPAFGQPSCGVILQGGHGTGKTYITEKLVGTG